MARPAIARRVGQAPRLFLLLDPLPFHVPRCAGPAPSRENLIPSLSADETWQNTLRLSEHTNSYGYSTVYSVQLY